MELGLGHSETIGALTVPARNMLPRDSKYEAQWWNRKVTRDGRYYGHEFDQASALEAATVYANKVSIGNLTTLRQFLETSMVKTRWVFNYINQFQDILNGVGRDKYNKGLKDLFGFSLASCRGMDKLPTQQITRFVLGFTRKRDLLVPEWSDDNTLWTPKIMLS